ncbi:hypothetical protein ISCGN_022239 [Ixodes scapularis]
MGTQTSPDDLHLPSRSPSKPRGAALVAQPPNRKSNRGVLQRSALGQLLEQGRLKLPKDLPLPSTRLPALCARGGRGVPAEAGFPQALSRTSALTATNVSSTTALADQSEMN